MDDGAPNITGLFLRRHHIYSTVPTPGFSLKERAGMLERGHQEGISHLRTHPLPKRIIPEEMSGESKGVIG